MVFMYAECLDGTKVPLRIYYTRNYLNLETELPDDWKHIVLIDFYKGRYDLCKETVVFINNNDGTVIVNQTKVHFKHGPIVKDRKTLMIEGLDRMHRFREHRCDLYTRGWWAFN